MSRSRTAASLVTALTNDPTLSVCNDLMYEYRLGPVYTNSPDYIPYWDICRCPSSCATNIGDSAICPFPTPTGQPWASSLG